MNVLYGYSLIPVTEAMAERKSFAFRPCRSQHDALAYVMEALKENNAPSLVVCSDIKAYYASIHHSWLLEHAPMDKRVLAEFLNAGIVFAGELFPSDGIGISEGANISPYLGNFVLDGLQAFVYRGLYGNTSPPDYSNGNLVRFADKSKHLDLSANPNLNKIQTKGKGTRPIFAYPHPKFGFLLFSKTAEIF